MLFYQYIKKIIWRNGEIRAILPLKISVYPVKMTGIGE